MDEVLKRLRVQNPGRTILEVSDPSFATYGKLLPYVQTPEMRRYLYEQTEMPETEDYVPCSEELMAMEEALQFTQFVYGETACQVGYYNGYPSKLNALEYHKCSEVLVEFEPCVLIVGHIWDIKEDQVASEDLKLFYVPAGLCVELYATTLHFAPCMATNRGVRQVVCQTATTNTPLHHPERTDPNGENPYLYQRNKWVLAHPEAAASFDSRVVFGITGENIFLEPVQDVQ